MPKEEKRVLVQNRMRRRWLKIVSTLACAVVFCTAYALIMPAVTSEHAVYCGVEEHQHSEACYQEQLICGGAADAVEDGAATAPDAELAQTEPTQPDVAQDDAIQEAIQTEALQRETLQTVALHSAANHEHSADCYVQEQQLICELEETEPHQHTEDCVETEQMLVCGSEEEDHQHDEGCYETIETYICGLEENAEGHLHTDECYLVQDVLQCPLEETDVVPPEEELPVEEQPSQQPSEQPEEQQPGENHEHTADCYQQVLICSQPEHTHCLQCGSDSTADVETAEDWERSMEDVELTGDVRWDVLMIAESQLGYQESQKNYLADEDEQKHGYTRYGAWYGDAYGDWCAMFVSFCLNYAGVPQDAVPYESSCPAFTEKLIAAGLYEDASYTPMAGDIILFDNDGDRLADHIGFVCDILQDEKPVQIKTIEGNLENCVQYGYHAIDAETILGYGRLPELTEEDLLEPLSTFARSAFGEPSVTPGYHKTIDAFRDGVDNPDTDLDNSSADLTDLYRLYLDVTPDDKPTDLILILDNSKTMFWNWGSDTSLGTRNDVMNVELKKFIPNFLNSHEGNRIYLGYYSGKQLSYTDNVKDFPVDQGGKDAASWDAYAKYRWGTAAESDAVLSWLMTVSGNCETAGENYDTGRNYAAGFSLAGEALKTANPEHNVKLVFLSSGVPTYFTKEDGTRGGNGLAVEEQWKDDWINLAKTNEERCQEATSQTIEAFKEHYPNLCMSAIGFGGSITEGGIAEEVLQAIPQNGGAYYHENWSNTLAGRLNNVLNVGMSKVTISDQLNAYVDIYSAQPDYKVTMKNGETETVLYENGNITADGRDILERVDYNAETRTVTAVFKPDYELESGYTYTLSYNIQTTSKAYDDFEKSGYTQMGDPDTDYDANQTSAYKMGYPSNAAASLAYWVRGDKEPRIENYAHPVIQVKRSQGSSSTGEEITLPHSKTIDAFRDDAENPDTTLDNNATDKTDLYRLYLDVLPLYLDKPTDLLLVLDNSGSMFGQKMSDDKTRNEAMNEALKRFIPEFLNTHTGNRISIVYFSGPNDYYATAGDLDEHNTDGNVANDAWTVYNWGSNADAAIAKLATVCENSNGADATHLNKAGTNYEAGLNEATKVLANRNSDNNVKMVFLSDGIPTHYIQSDGDDKGKRGGNGLSAEGQTSDYWLGQGQINEERCKQPTLKAISKFKREHPNLHMSSIAYSRSITGDAAYGVQAMPQNGGTCTFVTASDKLFDALTDTKTIKNMVLSDTLSQYVDLYTEQPDYKVVMRKTDEADIVLYENGKVTTDGADKLDSVTYNEETKTVSANFKPDYSLDIQWKYELSFNVQTTQAAYDTFAQTGYSHTGDAATDYGENKTSSGQPGFRSNANAGLSCTFNNETHKEVYDHPVVQAAVCKLVVEKTDSKDETQKLSGAEFTLYRKAFEGEDGETLEQLTGSNDSENQEETENPSANDKDKYVKVHEKLTTDESGRIIIEELVPGDYVLVETKAPEHYATLTAPIQVTLLHGTDGNSHIQGSEATVTIDDETLPLLRVENTRLEYELPQSGGCGTMWYTLGGLCLICMAAFLMYKSNHRRKGAFTSPNA